MEGRETKRGEVGIEVKDMKEVRKDGRGKERKGTISGEKKKRRKS